MIRKILIANRGEVAVRIIRACREMGIKSIAVYSEADKNALHTKLADEAICIGPAAPQKSYLNVKNILEAACITGADAIHPGFGFLSENSKFAKMCNEIGIKFIGPKPEAIELMGNKSNAKENMKMAGVPVVPGSDGLIHNIKEAKKIAKKIEYPVMLKASAGGGGKGIRVARDEKELEKEYNLVKQEAKAVYNDDSIYLEKFIENPRHVEIQIMADEHGNVVYLGDRDCTVQRRNQKMLEETPSPIINETIRKKMGEIAVKATKSVGYSSLGTIEFLVNKDKKFYFMEMNTRLQVEHPVTEMVTGIDLVKEQIKIASGEKLNITQKDIKIDGHSMEIRINAENPNKNFIPCAGNITALHLPGGNNVRVDTALYSGCKVLPYYDSMIAKIIVHGENRMESISKMKSALYELVIDGIDTNKDFMLEILNNKKFVNNEYDTSFVQKELLSKLNRK